MPNGKVLLPSGCCPRQWRLDVCLGSFNAFHVLRISAYGTGSWGYSCSNERHQPQATLTVSLEWVMADAGECDPNA